MKKFIALCLVVVLVFTVVSCGNKEISDAELRQKFPEYYNLDTFKGLEIYVWETEEIH